MAYSIYVYLKPEVVKAGNPYLDRLFKKCPWLAEPDDDGFIMIWVKPRYSECGMERFEPFFRAISEVSDYVVEISHDECELSGAELLIPNLLRYGFDHLIQKIV
jgi:hypothetical protein